ncbi:MAG: cysteine--tRNA ligase [Firmicutes bacterium]|nr:cysteine--tRNA ligase [Bacillota bacterium]
MTIQVYNTMEGRKVEFVPRDAGKVGIYACGPTVYNYIHLGNARPIVVFDAIRRYFKYAGYDVTYVQNFTDVDDKIIRRGQEEGISAAAVADKYIAAYFEDVQQLNVLKADVHPRVTEHMAEIIELVQQLIDNGVAYEVNGDVYFAVEKFDEYGKLSGRDLEDMLAGARVQIGDQKRNPMDFAVWKAAKPGEPAWESPWGQGRPGWHIECSAMSRKYLGDGFDIHGGGADLIFPHHENEIAQSEAASGCCFVRYWLHNGFITVNDEKMSKSVGNFFLLRDILENFPGDVVRFFLLNTHYRSPIDFDDEKLRVAAKSLARIRNAYAVLKEAEAAGGGHNAEATAALAAATETLRNAFAAAMNDDFNTALAIAAVFDYTKALNSHAREAEIAAVQTAVEAIEAIDEVIACIRTKAKEGTDELTPKLMELIIAIRQQARSKKEWATADYIRDELKKIGVVLEDGADSVHWKLID